MNIPIAGRSVLVWRDSFESSLYLTSPYTRHCPNCGTEVVFDSIEKEGGEDDLDAGVYEWATCPLCGWNYQFSKTGSWMGRTASADLTTAVLREFDLNAVELAVAELGSYLRSHSDDLYHLHWRRFEELVADVYGQHGHRVVLTQPTQDGGADVLVLANDSDVIVAVIECKKYKPSRRINVNHIRTLVGVAIRWDVRRATLITTTDFTRAARDAVTAYGERGIDLDLVAANDLLRMLGVYNVALPSLAHLDPVASEEIVAQNRQSLIAWEGPYADLF